MATWVTAETILTRAGARSPPSSEDSEWAEVCAGAVNAGLDKRLEGAAYIDPPPPAELVFVAQTAGIEAFKRKEAVFGITGYVDLQGAAIRIARDYLDSAAPIIARYATHGLG